ncbi:class I SAM-dependent methyltransferase [Peptococcus simiae]|uniref:Class I SAM-dependent methyltransferase n=1 Tax=Peptococcus simiae TaxID=1643805 RepID=A0ABW9GYJ5_9FIRM
MADFAEKSKEYDAWYETPLGRFVDARETECALSILPLDLGKSLLDAGCGTGRFTLKMSLLGHAMTGIDLSPEMLEIAKHKLKFAGLAPRFHEMDITNMDFADNSFDGLVSMALFEFVHEAEKALEECFRVVRPGGYVMIGTITGNSSWGEEYKTHMPREDSVFHQAAFKTMEEMKQLFPDYLLAAKESVFIPPTAGPENLTLENEMRLSQTEVGAFACLLWQKPAI